MTSTSVKYLLEFDKFNELWDLIPSNPEQNEITSSMISLFPIEVKSQHFSSLKKRKRTTIGCHYLLISHDRKRLINFSKTTIVKHTLGCCSPFYLNKTKYHLSVTLPHLYTISDFELFDMGIFNIVINVFDTMKYYHSCPSDNEIIRQFLETQIGRSLTKGDLVHIPLYDFVHYRSDFVFRHILIFDGETLVTPQRTEYSILIPPNLPYPEFDFNHFYLGYPFTCHYLTPSFVEDLKNYPAQSAQSTQSAQFLKQSGTYYFFTTSKKLLTRPSTLAMITRPPDFIDESVHFVLKILEKSPNFLIPQNFYDCS